MNISSVFQQILLRIHGENAAELTAKVICLDAYLDININLLLIDHYFSTEFPLENIQGLIPWIFWLNRWEKKRCTQCFHTKSYEVLHYFSTNLLSTMHLSMSWFYGKWVIKSCYIAQISHWFTVGTNFVSSIDLRVQTSSQDSTKWGSFDHLHQCAFSKLNLVNTKSKIDKLAKFGTNWIKSSSHDVTYTRMKYKFLRLKARSYNEQEDFKKNEVRLKQQQRLNS